MGKVLLITRPIAPPWDEASKNFAYTLAKKITGLELGVLTCGYVSSLPKNVRQHSIYTSNNFSYLQKVRLVKNIKKIQKNYDILHYLFTPAKLNSFLIKNFLRPKKNIQSVQTVATLREDLYSKDEIKKMLLGDMIVTYSDYSKNKLKKLGFEKVERIYPGIDLKKYKNKPKSSELMKQKGIANSDFVINFTGEYTRLGAMDDVIESFLEISQEIPKAKLSLAVRIKNKKDAQKKKEIKNKLKKRHLLKQVIFHDDGQYDMADVYNLADISVFPVQNMRGKFDVPLAVIEAMACEKPIIISNISILQEFVNDKNSVIINPGDVNQLSREILKLYQNKTKREAIGKVARKYVKDNFNIEDIASKYKKVYENLLRTRRRK